MRVAVADDPRMLRVLSAFFPEVEGCHLGAEMVEKYRDTHTGIVLPLSSRVDVRGAIDMSDGLTKVVGAVDTVMFQRTGANVMSIGFTTASNALARSIRAGGGLIANPKVTIVGGKELASAAIASAVELGATSITLCTSMAGGPGSAVTAAHRMGVDVVQIRPSKGVSSDTDLLIVTDTDDFAQLRSAVDFGIPNCLVALAVEKVDSSGLNVLSTVDDFLTEKATDHIRLLTGTNPARDDVRTAVENSR